MQKYILLARKILQTIYISLADNKSMQMDRVVYSQMYDATTLVININKF